jgi:integrase
MSSCRTIATQRLGATSTGHPWPSVVSSRVAPAPIPSRATSYGHCAGCNGNRKPSHLSCSHPSVARPSPRQALLGWWSALASRLSWASRLTRTCCVTCGFALANKGHDTRALQAYLGHRNIQHTVRYTELSPDRFKDFWR